MMTGKSDFHLAVLQEIVSQPTAPYSEGRVAARVSAYLREWGLPFTIDDAGNIIARYRHGPACRPLILMAHMDHPGFTIAAQGGAHGADWTARLEGGVATAYFERPVTVRIFPSAQGASGAGAVARIAGYAKD